MILPNASQMRAIDHCAINHFGVPGIVLMENAGLGTVREMEHRYGPLLEAYIPIFIGPGNNGGDGLVIARHLLQRKACPVLVFLIEPDKLTGDSATNLAIIRHFDLPTIVCNNSNRISETIAFLQDGENRFGPPAVFVDAIFGTGLCRSIEGHYREIINLLNSISKVRNIPVSAVDTPSGLDSDNGSVLGICVEADMTATYGYAKVGQLMAESSLYTGYLAIIDIGIPETVTDHVQVLIESIDSATCRPFIKRLQRGPDSHKGNFGHLLIIGGSSGKTGAALLTGRGALRSGCGLVSLCCPKDLNPIYESASMEMMTIPLASENVFNRRDFETILTHSADMDGIVLGPGIGQDSSTSELVVELYNSCNLPMVVDADGLNILAEHRTKLTSPPAPRILTPHPGEMARLIDKPTSFIQSNRLKAVQQCRDLFEKQDETLIVILKGAATLVAADNRIGVNTTGNPAMATGGMGDVLSGVIGSFICQGLSPVSAARLGVFLHGFSGDRLYRRSGVGFPASELADDLGEALQALQREGSQKST